MSSVFFQRTGNRGEGWSLHLPSSGFKASGQWEQSLDALEGFQEQNASLSLLPCWHIPCYFPSAWLYLGAVTPAYA